MCDRTRAASAARDLAEGAAPDERLRAMGLAYERLIGDRDLLRMQMQAYVSAEDPDIRAAARTYSDLFRFVEQASGAGAEDVAGLLVQRGATAFRVGR